MLSRPGGWKRREVLCGGMPQPFTYQALESIGRAIADLDRPTGSITDVGTYGTSERESYRPIAERDAVREDLIGAAFTIAQTYLASIKAKTPTQQSVCTVANYWKHRDQWDAQWNPNGSNTVTINAVRAMGEAPPISPGQLTRLAENALGRPFSTGALSAVL